jgi:hypothetical protein
MMARNTYIGINPNQFILGILRIKEKKLKKKGIK